jgi:hypothetical protein
LITVLRSPELQRSMGRQNFAAGLEMTIGSVVRNYLRWFELNKYKKALRASEEKGTWRRSLFSRRVRMDGSASLANDAEGIDTHGREGTGGNAQPIDFVDPLT